MFGKFISCGKCNGSGYIVTPTSATKCRCRKEWESDFMLWNRLCESGLLSDVSTMEDFNILKSYDYSKYAGADVNQNIRKLRKFTDNFGSESSIYRSVHMYWCGKQGTQKTYTAKGVLSILAKMGFSVYYIFTKDLVRIVMDGERNEETQKLADRILMSDCLVMDEFEEKRMALYESGYKQNVFTPWLKRRLETVRKSTIFISNSSIDEMKNGKLGDLMGDVVDRETKYSQFTFTDNYGENMNTDEFEKKLKLLWD